MDAQTSAVGHDIIVIGASAGGVEALSTLARGLPADLPAALFVVLHLPTHVRSLLPHILARAGPLPAHHAEDGMPVERGRIYIAPPGCHLVFSDGKVCLQQGPRVHGHRPAIDPLFRAAARVYGPRAVGVILTGTLSDGAAGLAALKAAGGVAIVQDPEEALYAGMPESALGRVAVDHISTVSQIPALLVQLATEPIDRRDGTMRDEADREKQQIQADIDAQERGERANEPSVLTCPDCGGVLWEMDNSGLLEYRCHVGHAYSAESLELKQSEDLEEALWVAVRSLTERAMLLRRLATRLRNLGSKSSAVRLDEQADEAAQANKLLRRLLLNGKDEADAQP